MALQAGKKPYNTFVKGIITEASPLTFPEDASIDDENFVLKSNGSRRRRLGLDIETDGSLSSQTWSSSIWIESALGSYEWTDAAARGLYNFGVVQIAETLYFYDISTSPIESTHRFELDFSIFRAPSDGSSYTLYPIRVASGNGFLFVTSRNHVPFYLEYNPGEDSITATEIQIKVRDFTGFNDGFEPGYKPTSGELNDYYLYNMYNRGWTPDFLLDYYIYNDPKVYPSKAETVSMYRRQTAEVSVSTGAILSEAGEFSPDLRSNEFVSFGNSDSTAGHFIIDPFTKDRMEVCNEELDLSLSVENIQQEFYRPKAVAFFAGRVFYAGIESTVQSSEFIKDAPSNGLVFFSQIVNEDVSKIGKCYQEYDPTSEEDSDLLSTDGGVIGISGCEQIYSLHSIDNSLVVVASNGIWQIGGGDVGFTAKDYTVMKVSEDGAVSSGATVEADGFLVYWAKSGIIMMMKNESSGLLSPTNLTVDSIQTLYQDIGSIQKTYAIGTFDRAGTTMSWLYNDSDEYTGYSYRYSYNVELRFNLTLKAFYKYRFSELDSHPPTVFGYINTPYVAQGEVEFDLTMNDTTDFVTMNNIQDYVTVFEKIPLPFQSNVVYCTVFPLSGGDEGSIKIGFCTFNNEDFLDFYSADNVGKDAFAYVITGYDIVQDASVNKYGKYLTTFLERTETTWQDSNNDDTLEFDNPSSCLCQARWDFSDHQNWGKWTTTPSSWTTTSTGWQTMVSTTNSSFQVYKLSRYNTPNAVGDPVNYGTTVIRTKQKIRGKGHALSLKFFSEPGKDCRLLGWYITFLGQTEE